MLAVTAYLSTDVAAVPLLWILPLATYLLTFVVAFSSRGAGMAALAARQPHLETTLTKVSLSSDLRLAS